MAKEIPVYLFTGFLESGKTTFIQGTLEDERFNAGERTLVIVCEEGIEEYDADELAKKNIDLVMVEDQETLNKEYMDLMDRKQAAFDSTVDATNVEDRDRFADEQYRLGEEMEKVRARIIENNNRLK